MIDYKLIDNNENNTIIFVHGFTQNYTIFNKQAEFFSDHFNCLLINLRGHGESIHNGPFGIVEYTEDIIDVLSSLELNNFLYWGTHTGTAIGLNLFFKNIFHINGLILEGTVIPGYNTPGINKNIERAKDVRSKKGLDIAIQDWYNNSEWFEYMRKNPENTRSSEHLRILESFKGTPWKTKLKAETLPSFVEKILEINIPILVYNGEYDMQEFYEMAEIISKNQNVTKYIIPEAGGFPLWENPNFVNRIVEEWLQKQKESFI